MAEPVVAYGAVDAASEDQLDICIVVEAVVRHLKPVAGMNGQAISPSRLNIVRAVLLKRLLLIKASWPPPYSSAV